MPTAVPSENAHIRMLRETAKIKGSGSAKLLLHSCCAPCSTRALTLLAETFDITIFFYNPNIYPADEYYRRLSEQRRLLEELPLPCHTDIIVPEYNHDEFINAVIGYENEREGGGRCRLCFELRLKRAVEASRQTGCEYFTTTLSVSPRKNAAVLNEIGESLTVGGVKYLDADLKKQDGYLKSIRLSEQYGLYRQKYCGCEFSLKDRLDNH